MLSFPASLVSKHVRPVGGDDIDLDILLIFWQSNAAFSRIVLAS